MGHGYPCLLIQANKKTYKEEKILHRSGIYERIRKEEKEI